MSRRDDEMRVGLERPDLAQFEINETPTPSTVAVTSRFRPDELAALFEEAERRGVKKTVVIHDLALEALRAQKEADDEPILLRPSDVARAVRSVGRPAA